ncbi:SOS response-associated peptidase family protein [Sphingomonas donggukensis]|uniref:SOS response-associated peptidase family protein n=1 Tax=Sphingomonas donggukensis TaxID=2949093 RepID=A0ABY4TU30_9SPHN|nr:SOS response-associated peptidase family protein [Sphingomonas donggukensis]URW75915.1 SOS response-associated peptidase family protein [Sphingomonas donggukensis]
MRFIVISCRLDVITDISVKQVSQSPELPFSFAARSRSPCHPARHAIFVRSLFCDKVAPFESAKEDWLAMSRLYTVMAGVADVATHFGAEIPASVGVPPETIEGNPGLVVLESGYRRLLKLMSWGFPRLTREMRLRGDPPGRIGLVADLTNPMWEHLVVDQRYRCLIPLTHFANPNGDPGEKTRTWFSVTGEPLVAWAGFCRNTSEFGPVYAGMTMTANALVEPYNDRMPVLLARSEYDSWLHGTIQDVIAFQFRPPVASESMTILNTEDRWKSGKLPPQLQPQMAFF